MSLDGVYFSSYGEPLTEAWTFFSTSPQIVSSISNAIDSASLRALPSIACAVLMRVSNPPINACTPRPVTTEASIWPARASGKRAPNRSSSSRTRFSIIADCGSSRPTRRIFSGLWLRKIASGPNANSCTSCGKAIGACTALVVASKLSKASCALAAKTHKTSSNWPRVSPSSVGISAIATGMRPIVFAYWVKIRPSRLGTNSIDLSLS